MSELSSQYRNAPRLRSSVTVDRTVLQEAGRRVAAEKRTGGWWLVAPALSALCVALFGVALLMKQGVPPLQPRLDNGSTLAGKSELESALTTSEEMVSEPIAEMAAPPSPELSDRSDEVAERDVDADLTELARIQSDRLGTATSQSAKRAESRQMRALSETLTDETASTDSAVRGPSGLVAESFSVTRDNARDTTTPVILQFTGEDWLRDQPADRFTLFVEENERAGLGVVDDLVLPSAIVELINGDVRSWILISGSFLNRDAAIEMASETGLASLQPRVLTFGELPVSLRR